MKSVYFLALVLLISCHKQDPVPMIPKQICDQETMAEFTIHNYAEFSKFINSYNDGDAYFLSLYSYYFVEIKPDYLSWAVLVNLRNICNSDTPNIEFSVLFHHPDPSLIPEGFVREAPNYGVIIPINSTDSLYFHKTLDYNFKSNFFGEYSAALNASIYFPLINKGSFSADSAYFFSNLDYMSCKITAHKPK